MSGKMSLGSRRGEEHFDTRDFYLGPSTLNPESEHLVQKHDDGVSFLVESETSSEVSLVPSLVFSRNPVSTPTVSSITTEGSDGMDPCEPITDFQVSREDNYLAIGTIQLHPKHDDGHDEPRRFAMHGRSRVQDYPDDLISMAQLRQWIRIEEQTSGIGLCQRRLHVYVLPEDVDRSGRGGLRDFRKVMLHLFKFVDRSPLAWTGQHTGTDILLPFDTPYAENEESLFYIFNTLRSPSPDLELVRNSNKGHLAVTDTLENQITDLKTRLYPYQQRSVAAMIQREETPAKLLDPRKLALQSICGRQYFVDLKDGSLLKTRPLYPEPRGGILAETMGYGKTLICIALILATRGHYPHLPEDLVDVVAFSPREKVGSLMSMAARRAKHEGVPWKTFFRSREKEGYHHDACKKELSHWLRAYANPIYTPITPNRHGKRESSNLVYLCSATLIIVPPNLLEQWQHEIKKHAEEDGLNVLAIESSSQEIPEWRELLDLDILLMSKSRFEQEYRDDDLNLGKTKNGSSRYQSPLTQLRWLRVICDEGHGFAGSSCRTNAIAMLDKMFIERRWVVSGTPSSTLHGVEVNLSTTSCASVDQPSTSSMTHSALSDRRKSIGSELRKRQAPQTIDQESKDLERLRLIVVNFLKLQPWTSHRGTSGPAVWNRYLAPAVDVDGKRRTSLALRRVLQTLIVRHRIEDIDTDLTLPALYTKVVYLKPSYHDKMAYNMFMMVLTSNYITSEREDEDYMFHPRNRKVFDRLITNLRQASFHWVGFTESEVENTLRISNQYLDTHLDLIDDDDGKLLVHAIVNARRALADPSWVAFSKLFEMGTYITGFPDAAKEAWSLDGRTGSQLLLGTSQARAVQKYVEKKINHGDVDPLGGLTGQGIRVMSSARRQAAEEQANQRKSTKADGEKQQIGANEEGKHRMSSASTASATGKKASAVPLKRRQSTKDTTTDVARPGAAQNSAVNFDFKRLPPVAITGFTSAKLTYLIDQLLIHSPDSKSIVFYSSNNMAFWIGDALELMGISCLIYANTLSVKQRNEYLSEFNREDSVRVLLMDLKQASHGLHIASANRVYIISPIWDQALESQAIKRAHRIGQTKEVHVETLVLYGTFEEAMVKRRQDIDQHGSREQGAQDIELEESVTSAAAPGDGQGRGAGPFHAKSTTKPKKSQSAAATARQKKQQSLLDDRHMVQVLKNIKFLQFTKEEEFFVEAQVARLSQPKLLFGGLISAANTTSPAENASNGVQSIVTKSDFNKQGKLGHVWKSNKGAVATITRVVEDGEPQRKKAKVFGFAKM